MAINGASEHSFNASVHIAADSRMMMNRGPLNIAGLGAPDWRPERASGQGVPSEGPPARCFPSDDTRFAACVQALFDACRTNEPLATAVEALLRETYPLAVIRPRHELAAIDGCRLWYAFRDGSLVPVADGDNP